MDREMKERLSLPLFLKKFLLRTYGLKDIATKQMMALLSSVRVHRKTNERQDLFARLIGLDEEDALRYSPMACDYFMLALSELYSSIRIKDVNQKRFLMTHRKEHENEDVLTALQGTQHTISDESITDNTGLAAIEGRSDTMSNPHGSPNLLWQLDNR